MIRSATPLATETPVVRATVDRISRSLVEETFASAVTITPVPTIVLSAVAEAVEVCASSDMEVLISLSATPEMTEGCA